MRTASRRMRAIWLSVATLAGGSGIWATHFIAMLAFEPGLPSAYHIGLTSLSLVGWGSRSPRRPSSGIRLGRNRPYAR